MKTTPTLQFSGELLHEVSSRGQSPRWTELRVYRTRDKTGYLTEECGMSNVAGEVPRVSFRFAATKVDAVRALGRGKLALELYRDLGWLQEGEDE